MISINLQLSENFDKKHIRKSTYELDSDFDNTLFIEMEFVNLSNITLVDIT